MSCFALDLDITNVTKGKIVKLLSESFEATLDVNPSERTQVSWSKVNQRTTVLHIILICNQRCHFLKTDAVTGQRKTER